MTTSVPPGAYSAFGPARRLATAALILGALAGVAGCSTETASSVAPTVTTAAATPEEQMIDAITAGDVEAVARLLDDGLSPDADLGTGGDIVTPLHRAAMDDQPEIASLLLEAGADANARTGGITVLMIAATSAGAETATVLLDGGADPTAQNLRNWGMYAIHYAARNGNVPVLALLADRGSDIDLLDATWSTPSCTRSRVGSRRPSPTSSNVGRT